MSEIIFVHGAGLDSRAWDQQTRFFTDSVAVDLPGHGRSTAAPMDDVADYATWLGEEIRRLRAGPLTLAGHSLGSLIALETAAHNPDFVDHLVLIATSSAMPVHHELMATAAEKDPAAAAMLMKWSLTQPRYSRPKTWVRDIEESFVAAAEAGALAMDLVACDSYSNAITIAAEVKCPTLLILGEHDIMTRPAGARLLGIRAVAPGGVLRDGALARQEGERR